MSYMQQNTHQQELEMCLYKNKRSSPTNIIRFARVYIIRHIGELSVSINILRCSYQAKRGRFAVFLNQMLKMFISQGLWNQNICLFSIILRNKC